MERGDLIQDQYSYYKTGLKCDLCFLQTICEDVDVAPNRCPRFRSIYVSFMETVRIWDKVI
jgi:hypothetical protein